MLTTSRYHVATEDAPSYTRMLSLRVLLPSFRGIVAVAKGLQTHCLLTDRPFPERGSCIDSCAARGMQSIYIAKRLQLQLAKTEGRVSMAVSHLNWLSVGHFVELRRVTSDNDVANPCRAGKVALQCMHELLPSTLATEHGFLMKAGWAC